MRTMDNGNKLSDELLESISGGRKYAPSGYIQSLDESSEEPDETDFRNITNIKKAVSKYYGIKGIKVLR